ncbi:MAG TPA: hypothetical protein VLT13_15295 [Bacteroidota bacterium]|nr:hypothetical protein [Bacteroidota bacterium]
MSSTTPVGQSSLLQERTPLGRTSMLPALALLFMAMCAGCVNPSGSTYTNFEKEYPPTVPDSVEITTEQLLRPPYLEIGYLYVQESSLDRAQEAARARAAQMGGHKIVDARAGITVTQIGSIIVVPVFDRSFFVRGTVVRHKPIAP